MGNWIPDNELTDAERHDIKALKNSRNGLGSEGVLKMLYLTEKKVSKILISSKDEQLFRAQGIAQFLDELSELINLKQ